VARCHANEPCPAPAERLIRLSREGACRSGRARVGLINRAVDLAITPVSDEAQWGVPDHWSNPFETLRSNRGDCEDYAIVKYAALLEAGVLKDDFRHRYHSHDSGICPRRRWRQAIRLDEPKPSRSQLIPVIIGSSGLFRLDAERKL
jgi:Bacterial transglutaminase-like cysteine proteinase BTLCP